MPINRLGPFHFLRKFGSNSWLVGQIIRYSPSSLVPALVGVASTSLFTKVLDAGEYGKFSIVIGISGFVAAVGSQWLHQSLGRYLPGEPDESARRQLKQSAVVVFLGLVCLVLIAFGLVLPVYRVGVVNTEILWVVVTGILHGVISAIWVPINGIFQAEMRADVYTRYNLLLSGVRFCLSGFLILTFLPNANGLILASMCSVLLLLPSAWREATMGSVGQAVRQYRALIPTVRQLVVYGVPMMGWALVANLLNVSDRYVIQFYRGSSEVGIYSASYTLVTGVGGLFSAPILLATHPFLMRAWGHGDQKATALWLGRILEWFTLIGVCAVGLVWLISDDIAMMILGPEFHEGHLIMPVVLAGVFVWQTAMYLHKPLEFAGKTGVMLGLASLSVLVNITANILLVPIYGYVVAAYTTLVCYGLYAVLATVSGMRVLQWPLRWKRLLVIVIVCSANVVLAAVIRNKLHSEVGYWGSLLISMASAGVGPLGVATYLLRWGRS